MSRSEVPHNRAALVLLGVILVAIAAGIGSTWVDDGDGTCRALYRPNLERTGCARKLAPAAFVSAALLGGAVLSWDVARRRTRPSGGVLVGSAIGITVVAVVLLVVAGLDRRDAGGRSPAATAPPAPAPTSAPSGAWLVVPSTVPRR